MRGTPAGRLKHRIEIVRRTAYVGMASPYGASVDSYQSLGKHWAAVEPLSARESIQAASNSMDITHRVTMRYTPCGVAAKDILRLNGRIFEISSIINVEEANTELQLLCTERTK